MEGTETGWGRPAEPAPRWRALLDRALTGTRTGEHPPVGQAPLGQASAGRAVPGRGVPGPAGGHPAAAGQATVGKASVSPGAVGPPSYDPSAFDAFDSPSFDSPPGQPGSGFPLPVQSAPAQQPMGHSPQTQPPVGRPVPGQLSFGQSGLGRRRMPPPIPPAQPQQQPPPIPPPGPLPVPPPVPTAAPVSGGRLPGYGGQLEWRQTQPNGVESAIATLRRSLGHPRVLAFANPKGGVHKTTATVLAAATIGSVRGRGVLAWDDNELRGTLGLRAGSARHARTIRHLIADLTDIEASHGEQLLDRLDDYLRHASDGSYDVLAGEENPRFAQRLDQRTVRRVLELLCRTHDVICVDTGNNVESVNWQTVLQACDQLVITTVPREDAAFTADWMLDLLHDVGLGTLVENAVTLLSCPTPGRSPLLDDLIKHFGSRTRAVAVVPYDPALESGSSIEYPQLHQETRNAWLRAAGTMLEPFVR